jgi:AhpD family alkylhydroperoxidase
MTDLHLSDSTPRAGAFPRAVKRLAALQGEVDASTLSVRIQHLVKLRASQVNGCAYCIDLHITEALRDGIDQTTLNLVSVWSEVDLFDAREQAALAFTEAVTLVAETHVPRAVYDAAAAVFDEEELGALLWAIITINAWNRMAIALRGTPESLKPAAPEAAPATA